MSHGIKLAAIYILKGFGREYETRHIIHQPLSLIINSNQMTAGTKCFHRQPTLGEEIVATNFTF